MAKETKRNPTLINRAKCKKFMLDEAQQTHKPRLQRVSSETLDYLEHELVTLMMKLVRMSPHGGPKTIYPPERG